MKLLNDPTTVFIGSDINDKHVFWHIHSNTDGRRIVKQLEELDTYVILNENQQATTKYDTAIDIPVLHSSLTAHSQWEAASPSTTLEAAQSRLDLVEGSAAFDTNKQHRG